MMRTILKSVSILGLAFALHSPLAVQAAEIHVKPATELSGSAVTPDGKGLLIAEDERVGAVLLIPEQPATDAIHGAVPVKFERKRKKVEPGKGKHRLMPVQDFEGIASDREEYMFFVGSHNSKYHQEDDENYRRFDREFLIRASLEEDDDKEEWELKLRGEYRGLLTALKSPFKKEFDIELFPDDASNGCLGNRKSKSLHPNRDLNIEGLAYHNGDLYIGFRAPLTPDDEAIIAVIDAKKPFKKAKDSCEKELKVKLMPVDLDGAGIRSLDWDSEKKRMLILSGRSNSSEETEQSAESLITPKLWEYEPDNGDPKELCSFTKESKLTPEGVSRWREKIAVVFDDEGKRASAKIEYLIEPDKNDGTCEFK